MPLHVCGGGVFRGATSLENNEVGGARGKLTIVGAGPAGCFETWYAYRSGVIKHIELLDKNLSLNDTTVMNIYPSLTFDEIVSVVPQGPVLKEKLGIKFNEPGGIKITDVPEIDSPAADSFIQQVLSSSYDAEGYEIRTSTLLQLGKRAMALWQKFYDDADADLKAILDASNFNPCREPNNPENQGLHDGYRIDLLYGIENAAARAQSMVDTYRGLGSQYGKILTPAEVLQKDPSLTAFVNSNAKPGSNLQAWRNNASAVWRPGGCIDMNTFLPKFYAYFKGKMGNNFQLKLGKKLTGVSYITKNGGTKAVNALHFGDAVELNEDIENNAFVFCPGEAVGILKKLGLQEPAYAGFAGPSLTLTIPINKLSEKDREHIHSFNHCMEVHKEGVVLAWQARIKDDKIVIGVAGTKSFYGDQRPTIDQEFATDRNILHLNMVNDVLPHFISCALNRDTTGETMTVNDLNQLVNSDIAKRWVGVRAVAYDGFPTVGKVYRAGVQSPVYNARVTTGLGSGGGSFVHAAVLASVFSEYSEQNDPLYQQVLAYGDSRRAAQDVESKLLALGITLPTPPAAVGSYVAYKIMDNMVYISGQLPVEDGAVRYTGKITGNDITKGYDAARLCGVNIIAQLKAACGGDLNRVKDCVSLDGFVNCLGDFTQHPKVVNGASDLMVAVFGKHGLHTRAAVGVSSLPLDSSVEVKALFELFGK